MKSIPRAALAISLLFTGCARDGGGDVQAIRSALGTFNVLTRNYNDQRTGANLTETTLTTANVNTGNFGKLFELAVDDQVWAGVLYASALSIAGGTHDVLYVATVNNSIYAFDADTGGTPLWQANFNNGFRPPNHTEVGSACGTYNDMSGNIGIVGTPVIDGVAGTLFVVTRTVENSAFVQRIRALDITTGAERVAARTIGTIDPQNNNQHAALSLSQGMVYVAWASHCDTGAYHGRVLAFATSDLSQVAGFDAVPAGSQAGIWMSGAAPIIDGSGNLFLATGNGSSNPASNQFGEAILKLGPTLTRLDYFIPSNFSSLNSSDLDLGSSGPMNVPGTSLLVMGGKGGGTCYLVDMNNMGQTVSGDTQIPQKWQCVDPTNVRSGQSHHLHNAMVAWQSPAGLNLYTWGENDFGRAWRFGGATFNTPAVSVSNVLPPMGMPGGMMTLSASGSTAGTGILWASMPLAGDANQNVVPGVLRAFNAEDLTQEFWNSALSLGDEDGNFSKGSVPVVASGKVYLGSLSNKVNVYGPRVATPNLDRTTGGTATGTGTACNTTTETVAKAYDNDLATKWCVTSAPSTSVPISTAYTFSAGAVFAINTYTVTTGNDVPARDPKNWTFQGCPGTCTVGSDTGWVTLDTRTNQFAGAGRFQTNTYAFANTTAYQQFRLRVTANNGDTTRCQISELEMFDGGGGTCTPESDSAFCARLGENCGQVSGTDNCGASRTVASCGTCTAPQTCGGGGVANVCGATDLTEGGTAAGTGAACTGTQGVVKAYDNLMTSANFTTWCVKSSPSPSSPVSTTYDFAGTSAFAITSYTITNGADNPTRDPRDWTLQGCQGTCAVGSDAGWTTLDTRSGQFVGAPRFQTNTYAVNNGTAFQQYRLRFTANNGASSRFQLIEIQMFGQ